LAASSDLVALKLDVEGYEFRLLKHMLLTTPRQLCGKVDVMAIEWHGGHLLKTRTVPNNTQDVLSWLLNDPLCNVSVVKWV